MLNNEYKKYLRGRAHNMKPSVSIGKEGVTGEVIKEIEKTAEAKELLKIKILKNSPLSVSENLMVLQKKLKGEIVGSIGRVIIYFMPGKEKSLFNPDFN